MAKMSPKEMERRLGLQYAQLLKETASTNPNFGGVYRDCEEVINGSLSLLEHYNKVTMAMKSKRVAGLFS